MKEEESAGSIDPPALRTRLILVFIEFSRHRLLPELNCSLIYEYSSKNSARLTIDNFSVSCTPV